MPEFADWQLHNAFDMGADSVFTFDCESMNSDGPVVYVHDNATHYWFFITSDTDFIHFTPFNLSCCAVEDVNAMSDHIEEVHYLGRPPIYLNVRFSTRYLCQVSVKYGSSAEFLTQLCSTAARQRQCTTRGGDGG